MNKVYIDAMRLLLRMVPDVFDGNFFALKGGTAINNFIRDMPRLSVDLDFGHVNRTSRRKEAGGENCGILKIALDGMASLRHFGWLFKIGC
jgi:predicted nucleotidyltransferase component of viral defense system